METMTLMPMAPAQALTARALPNADVRVPWTIGMPSRHVVATCPSQHFGTKAYGTRRLGEPAST